MRDNAADFDCKKCVHNHHCDEDGAWPKSNGPSPFPIIELDRNGYHLESRVCLLSLLTDRTKEFFKLHKHYQQGHLLQPGGLYEQPNVYLRAMEIING